jgi:hypothetical protein
MAELLAGNVHKLAEPPEEDRPGHQLDDSGVMKNTVIGLARFDRLARSARNLLIHNNSNCSSFDLTVSAAGD